MGSTIVPPWCQRLRERELDLPVLGGSLRPAAGNRRANPAIGRIKSPGQSVRENGLQSQNEIGHSDKRTTLRSAIQCMSLLLLGTKTRLEGATTAKVASRWHS